MEFNIPLFLKEPNFFWGVLSYLLLGAHLILQRALGQLTIKFFSTSDNQLDYGVAIEFFIGLLVYLNLLLLLKCFQLPWEIALFLPYLLLAFHRSYEDWIALSFARLSWNRALWYLTHTVIGFSLFTTVKGAIASPWRNTYGDFPFHMSMIASFSIGDIFPPEYVIYAGKSLSYPFLINLWSASLWYFDPTWFLLSCIFALQWFVCWAVAYECVDGDKRPWIPWLIVFGGGCYFAISKEIGALPSSVNIDSALEWLNFLRSVQITLPPSSVQIDSGLGWTNFLTTVWIPQRSSVFGMAASLAALKLYFSWEDQEPKRSITLLLAGLILGLSPLVHTHFGLITGLFISCSLLMRLIYDYKNYQYYLLHYGSFFLAALLSLAALPFLLGKEGLVTYSPFYFFSKHGSGFKAVALLFVKNFWLPLALAACLWFKSSKHRYFFALLAVFSLTITIKVSIWKWDQVKLFMACYLILIFLWSQYHRVQSRVLLLFVPFLVFPTLLELRQELIRGDTQEIASKGILERAETIREKTPKDSILLSRPRHNGPAVMSGRRQFMGYEGWLWSHGIDYQDRKEKMQSLEELLSCEGAYCPDYLLWGNTERAHWKVFPRDDLEPVAPEVYKIKE